jgi:DNA-binding CsgD family transcriptional regulator
MASTTHGYQTLTDKEKQTLRLLLDGHDAKSMARHFGLSVHTINERLRDARRKLSASSSREAARLLREAEGADPQSLGDKGFGDAEAAPAGQEGATAKPGRRRRAAWTIGGLAMIPLAIAAALALSAAPQHRPATAAHNASATVAETAATQAARRFLALVDAGNWRDSYAAWAEHFHSVNTFEAWRSASVGGRVPLGRVLSRRLVSNEDIPEPPNGHQLVRFRTSFAKKPNAIEKLTLVQEGGAWKIAGYTID